MHALQRRLAEHAGTRTCATRRRSSTTGARPAPRCPTRTASCSACRSCRARSSTRSARSPASPAAACCAPRSRPSSPPASGSCSPTTTSSCMCPFWSGSPYELLFMPRRHELHLQDADDDSPRRDGPRAPRRDGVPQRGARRRRLQPRVPHRAAPARAASSTGTCTCGRTSHTIAGFERGTGVLINVVPPEQAAEVLRGVAALA